MNEPVDSHQSINQSIIIAKGDSGASANYWRDEDKAVLQNIHPNTTVKVTLPNAQPIISTLEGTIPLSSKLSSKARQATVLPHLQSSSLISLGQLCDDNCKVVLDKKQLNVYKDGQVVLTGYRNLKDGLWDIPIMKQMVSANYMMPATHPGLYSIRSLKRSTVQPVKSLSKRPQIPSRKIISSVDSLSSESLQQLLDEYKAKDHQVNVIIRKKQSKQDLAKYLHAACFSPTKAAFTAAISKNNFSSWPGLTANLINNHLPKSIFTYQGHMSKERQGLQSTKTDMTVASLSETLQDSFPVSETPNTKTYNVCYALLNPQDIVTGYMDLTGRFPKRSSRGNQYILVAYHFDANLIKAVPLKNRRGQVITEAWEQLHNEFATAGVAPKTYVLDNEKSKDLIDSFTTHNIDYQLVAPYRHCKQAERAIKTFKEHFKSGLASVDPNFPLSEWDRLIPQANITLNLLRNSRVNPKLSAYAYLYGDFNFRATPLAPPGTKVLAYISPEKRGTWDLNGEVGWYVGPSLHHYRCVQCYFPRTRMIRDCDTVEFFPHAVPFPRVTVNDHLKQAATDIISILSNPPKTTVPSLLAGEETNTALYEIAKLLKRADPIPDFNHQEISKDISLPRVLHDKPRHQVQTPVNNTHVIPFETEEIAPSPSQSDPHVTPATNLQAPSNLPKNLRFNNAGKH